MELSVPSFLHLTQRAIALVLRYATIHYTVMYIGDPLRSATGAMTQCDDSNVYWHPIVLNTLLKISSYIYVKI